MMLNSHLLLLRSPYCFSQTCFPNVSPRCSELITNMYGIFVIPKKIKFTIHIKSSSTNGFLAGCIHTLGAFTWAILSKGGTAIPPRNTNLAFDNKPPASSENCANQWTWIRFVCIWYSTHTHTHTHLSLTVICEKSFVCSDSVAVQKRHIEREISDDSSQSCHSSSASLPRNRTQYTSLCKSTVPNE